MALTVVVVVVLTENWTHSGLGKVKRKKKYRNRTPIPHKLKNPKIRSEKKIYGNQLFLVYFDWVDDKHLDMTWVVCCFSTWNLLLLFVTLVLPSVHISIATCVADNFFLSAWKDKENTIDMSRTTEIFRKAFFFFKFWLRLRFMISTILRVSI